MQLINGSFTLIFMQQFFMQIQVILYKNYFSLTSLEFYSSPSFGYCLIREQNFFVKTYLLKRDFFLSYLLKLCLYKDFYFIILYFILIFSNFYFILYYFERLSVSKEYADYQLFLI